MQKGGHGMNNQAEILETDVGCLKHACSVTFLVLLLLFHARKQSKLITGNTCLHTVIQGWEMDYTALLIKCISNVM